MGTFHYFFFHWSKRDKGCQISCGYCWQRCKVAWVTVFQINFSRQGINKEFQLVTSHCSHQIFITVLSNNLSVRVADLVRFFSSDTLLIWNTVELIINVLVSLLCCRPGYMVNALFCLLFPTWSIAFKLKKNLM